MSDIFGGGGGDAGRLERVRRAAREGGRRSKLFHWLRDHRADLEEEFRVAGPSWARLAEVFAAEGLTDRGGKPPTARGAKQTWARVLREAEKDRRLAAGAARLRGGAKPAAQPPAGPPPAVRLLPPAPPPAPAPAGTEGQQRFLADLAKRGGRA